MKRALVLFLACVALLRCAGALTGSRFAEIEFAGPLANAVISTRGGETRVEGELRVGETRVMLVPVATQELSTEAPAIRFDEEPDPLRARGTARFLGWREPTSALSNLSPGLRARARPALAETPLEISSAAPLVLLAAAIGVLYLRKKPRFAVAIAIVAALATRALVHAPVRDVEASVSLVDGDANETRWRSVDAAVSELAFANLVADFELASEPADLRLSWRGSFAAGSEWRVAAVGARIFASRILEFEEGLLTRAANRYAAFDEVWLREAGEWHGHGAWEFGAELPTAREARVPPAWLAANLPQGVTLLVARVRGGMGRPQAWVRVSGI